jgi:hypothetical protein
MKEFGQMPRDQVERARGVPAHAAQDLAIDVLVTQDPERAGGDRLFPFGKTILELEIGVEKMPAGSQHSRDLRQETREGRITVGRFDIDYQIEGVWFEGQIFGVALDELMQVPDDFLFGLKVTDTITIKKFPKPARFGDLAGKPNQNFLNAELFAKAFLHPCESIRSNVRLLMFEFSRFWPADYEHGRDFIADLDKFLGQLPKGWPYGVEMRNRNWLRPDYFECLSRHHVAHVFNSWEAMPPVGEQMAMPGSRTNPDLVAARFLLKPGR